MADKKRMAKQITKKEDIDFLVNLTEDDLQRTTTIMELFGEFKGKARFEPYDTVTIPANSYGPSGRRNKEPIDTTVGKWIFNKFFIENDLFNLFKYINDDITKKVAGKMNDDISYAILENELDLSALKRYIMKTQKYQPYVHILAPNQTMAMLLITDKINKKKAELLAKYSKEIKAKDEKTVGIIEDELLKYAKEELADDPSMDSYNSGAKGSFGNNFKNLFVMRGAIKDPDPTKSYNIITSSYMDGVKKEEYADLANSLSAGPFKRAKKTEIGGYWEKLLLAALQHLVLLDEGSDCGTSRTITVDVDKDNIKEIMYSYVKEGNRLIEITSKNMSSFVGKTVQLRFSSLCESKNGFCNKCAGNLFYRIGIKNVGVTTPQIPSKLKTLSMKSFHDSQVKLHEMSDTEVMKVFGV